jgi:hypothetical protein
VEWFQVVRCECHTVTLGLIRNKQDTSYRAVTAVCRRARIVFYVSRHISQQLSQCHLHKVVPRVLRLSPVCCFPTHVSFKQSLVCRRRCLVEIIRVSLNRPQKYKAVAPAVKNGLKQRQHTRTWGSVRENVSVSLSLLKLHLQNNLSNCTHTFYSRCKLKTSLYVLANRLNMTYN